MSKRIRITHKSPPLGMNSFVVFSGLLFGAPLGAAAGMIVGSANLLAPGYGVAGGIIGGLAGYGFVWFLFSGDDPSA